MIPEYDNEKPIRFQWDIENPENAHPQIDDYGYPVRKSHANYVGTRIQLPNDKMGYTHFTMLAPPLCYVASSTINEHGVFAAKNFTPGELIEESKIIILDATEKTSKDWILNRYAMALPCDCNICKVNGKSLFVANGNIMIYNHSDNPNSFYVVEKPFRKIKIIALQNIKKGEEITFYYGADAEQKFKDIPKYYPRPNIPEGMPAFVIDQLRPFISSSNCLTCKENEKNNVTSSDIQFRSMIVPERIVE